MAQSARSPRLPSAGRRPRSVARSLYGRRAKTPTGGSVAQWIAHWTSSVVTGVIQRLWVRVPPESHFAAGARRSFSGFRDRQRAGEAAAAPGRCRSAGARLPLVVCGEPRFRSGARGGPGTGGEGTDPGRERSSRTRPSRRLINVHGSQRVRAQCCSSITSFSSYCYRVPKRAPAAQAWTAAGGGGGAATCPQRIHPPQKKAFSHALCLPKSPQLPTAAFLCTDLTSDSCEEQEPRWPLSDPAEQIEFKVTLWAISVALAPAHQATRGCAKAAQQPPAARALLSPAK